MKPVAREEKERAQDEPVKGAGLEPKTGSLSSTHLVHPASFRVRVFNVKPRQGQV